MQKRGKVKYKAQAAMEFIMTYGWAIVVVLIVITALSHFGILNPGNIFPERCILQLGLECVDYKVTQSEVALIIKNTLGTTITIRSTGVSVNNITCSSNSSQIMPSNARSVSMISGCSNGMPGERFKGEITISYTKKGLLHIAKGTIIAEISPEMMLAEPVNETAEPVNETAEPAETCSDGTLYEQCSATKPKYCDTGNLVENCQVCGCDAGQTCNSINGACSISTCSDGTAYGGCSITEPLYCEKGTLIDNCQECGCPSGEDCSINGYCYNPILNTLSDGSTEKNLIFTDVNKQTVYLEIPKGVNVISAMIDLRWGYSDTIKTENSTEFTTQINEILNTCQPDTKGNCLVPITFHSDSALLLLVSNINVTFWT